MDTTVTDHRYWCRCETCEPGRRAEATAGLRALADYIDANPTVPFDVHPRIQHCVRPSVLGGHDAAVTEVHRIAAAIGTEVKIFDTHRGDVHYVAGVAFGPVEYVAVYIHEGGGRA
ncbi:hypothetical protein [Salininema proteolyticum]|uniref:Uncharacterized protein n=1 Tax=Salininema proteolyticum TaxID=1607685 RepID=A0ABV8TT08_9ACTN